VSVITWVADHALGARRRVAEIRREIAEHDAQASHLQTDITRWTEDLARKTEQAMEGAKNELAASGHLYSGAMRSQLEHVMEQAQEAWRNQASGSVRAFLALAREEDDAHDRRRHGGAPNLGLSDELRRAVASWQARPYPIPDTGEDPLHPRDLLGVDTEIAPLLDPSGLTWEAARRAARSGQ
jgi:hypothetical protein